MLNRNVIEMNHKSIFKSVLFKFLAPFNLTKLTAGSVTQTNFSTKDIHAFPKTSEALLLTWINFNPSIDK